MFSFAAVNDALTPCQYGLDLYRSGQGGQCAGSKSDPLNHAATAVFQAENRVVLELVCDSLVVRESIGGCSDPGTPSGRRGVPRGSGNDGSTGAVLLACEKSVRCIRWPTLTTAPRGDVAARIFHVIHPFHPFRGQPFELVAYKSARGEDRVYFYNHDSS